MPSSWEPGTPTGINVACHANHTCKWDEGIDELRIYQAALDQDAIAAVLGEGPTGPDAAEAVFSKGIKHVAPRGDISMGEFTNE